MTANINSYFAEAAVAATTSSCRYGSRKLWLLDATALAWRPAG